MAMSFMTELIFWQKKRLRIRQYSLLYFILIHGNDKHDRLLVQLIPNGLWEAPIWVRFCKCHVFEMFLICPSIVLENSEFYSRTAYSGVVNL